MVAKDGNYEIVYSRQSGNFIKGKRYSNPRFFSTPRAGVTKVWLVGDWPIVEKAYKALGVPVEHLDELAAEAGQLAPTSAPRRAAEPAPEPKAPETHPEVEIPAGWRDLPWIGHPSIRSLAQQLSDQTVLNKGQAVAVISAELARRGVDDVVPIGTMSEPAAVEVAPHEPEA